MNAEIPYKVLVECRVYYHILVDATSEREAQIEAERLVRDGFDSVTIIDGPEYDVFEATDAEAL